MSLIANRPMYIEPGTNQDVTNAAALVTLPTGCEIIRLASAEDAYILFGDANVVADDEDTLLPAGVEYFAKGPATHISVIRKTADGEISISKAT